MKLLRIFQGKDLKTYTLFGTIFVFACFLPCPPPSHGADIDVSFQSITTLDGRGIPKTEFLPGEEIQIRVQLRVVRSTANPFSVRLRMLGDGWYEVFSRQPPFGRWITWGGTEPRIYVAEEASPGKVSLVLDVFSEQDTVSLQGRRHAYITIRCPPGLPTGMTERLQVGRYPYAMALTRDGRHLYVTSEEDRNVTVIDVETKTVVTELVDPDLIGQPTGVAPSPRGQEMLVADSALQVIHVIDADAHVLVDSIAVNPTGELGIINLGDLAVNPVRNEAYVADFRDARLFVVNLASYDVRQIPLSTNLLLPPLGLNPVKVLVDPENPFRLFVLCQGLPGILSVNEVIKVNLLLERPVDFVRFKDREDRSSSWPAWSMAVSPVTNEVYVLLNPGGFESTYPTMQSKVYAVPKNLLSGPGKREFHVGSSLWDLTMREDGRSAYAIDSYRGEIVVIDVSRGVELRRCAIPVEPGGRLLIESRAGDRLYVGNWTPGYVDIVE